MKKDPKYLHYIGFFILYFFFNTVLLKEGLLYTSLLAPVFLYWLYKQNSLGTMMKWGILLLIPIPFQLRLGPDASSYIISTLMVFASWIFLFTALQAVRVTRHSLEDIFLKVLIVNFALLIIALAFLPFSSLRDILWNSIPMSKGLSAIPRLKLLAYEPSHYALLLSPVFLFFLLKVLTGKSSHPLILSGAVLVPLLLSLSFGVIGALFLALSIGALIYIRILPDNSRRIIFYGLSLLVLITMGLWIFWPDNALFIRIGNIFAGADSSSKGRLLHSFMFAKDIVLQYGAWLGVGPGQVKILAHDLIVNFYHYTGDYAEVVRIPNSMGEILAIYGVYGFVLKIILEIYFFIRLRIYSNLFTFILFLFMFIYQFTGSFLVNAAEIGCWAFVFQSRLSEFDFENLKAVTK